MLKSKNGLKKINTDADPLVRGLYLQKLRATDRLFQALIDGRKYVMCTIEYIDDVLEVEMQKGTTNYVTEQDKSYATSFSLNSVEIKKTLRIFFDNWYFTAKESEQISFVFYTNTKIAKEKRVGVLKDEKELPDEPLLQLLVNKEYDKAIPFLVKVFSEYYIMQHSKHDDVSAYKELVDSLTFEEWNKFLSLIEWNFEQKTEQEIRKDIDEKVLILCNTYNVEERYGNKIVTEVINLIESRTFEEDYLNRMVNIFEVKDLFNEYVREAKVQEKLDPIYMQWENIDCGDIRSLEAKIISVVPNYDYTSIMDLNDEWSEGQFEQEHFSDKKKVSAYKYRVYKCCKKVVRDAIGNEYKEYSSIEINEI